MRNNIISSNMFKSIEGNYNKCFEIKSGSVYINVSINIDKEKK